MNDISELERRISAALDRIGGAIERNGGADTAELEQALEAERVANAQLQARVAALKEQRDTAAADHATRVAELEAALLTRDETVARLKAVTAELRASNTALREANAAGLADAGLVNAAMASELAALKATDAARAAEVAEVLAMLEPLMEEPQDA